MKSPAEGDKKIHEMKREFPEWDLVFAQQPEAAREFALGLWEHQIGDQSTGNFSRHTNWEKHDPRTNYDFPKEASYMLDVWSRAYVDTSEPVFLHAIEVLTKRYRSKVTSRGLVRHGEYSQERCIPIEMLYLAINGHRAALRLPAGPARENLLELTQTLDAGFLGLDHDPLGEGFIRTCDSETGEVTPWRA